MRNVTILKNGGTQLLRIRTAEAVARSATLHRPPVRLRPAFASSAGQWPLGGLSERSAFPRRIIDPPQMLAERKMLLNSTNTPSTSTHANDEMIITAPLLLLSLYSAANTEGIIDGGPFPATINDLQSLNRYMEQFFTVENEETPASWGSKLPTQRELSDLRELVRRLYMMEKFEKCTPKILDNFPALGKWLNVSLFLENYCVIHEKIPKQAPLKFPRAFGYAVLASPQITRRSLHHSAAHFQSDGKVCEQAAVLFQRSNGRSLVVAGASRYAINGTHPSLRNGSPLTPDQESSCQKGFTKTDAAHNDNLVFHHFNIAIRDAGKALGEDATFIQWHGMAETSCEESHVFVSAGGPADCPVYAQIGSNPNKVATMFNLMARGMSAATPRTDLRCKLTGGSNIFGRYIHGVTAKEVCFTSASKTDITGNFIHIEQKRVARQAHDTWINVLDLAFPASGNSKRSQNAPNRVALH